MSVAAPASTLPPSVPVPAPASFVAIEPAIGALRARDEQLLLARAVSDRPDQGEFHARLAAANALGMLSDAYLEIDALRRALADR
jgi:hypothetical protein